MAVKITDVEKYFPAMISKVCFFKYAGDPFFLLGQVVDSSCSLSAINVVCGLKEETRRIQLECSHAWLYEMFCSRCSGCSDVQCRYGCVSIGF